MTTREITREIELPMAPERVFELLVTPSAIRRWWSATSAIVMPEEGGLWAASWGADEDAPDYVACATLVVFEPPRRVVFADYRYFARTGPLPFEADFRTEFTVRAAGSGAILRVCQSGFPADSVADDFYAGCEQGWRDTFEGIRKFVGDQDPGGNA